MLKSKEKRKKAKQQPTLSEALFLSILTIIIFFSLTFFIPSFYSQTTKEDCKAVVTEYVRYGKDYREGYVPSFDIYCSDGKYWVDSGYVDVNEFEEQLKSLKKNSKLTILLHPQYNNVVELTANGKTLVTFEDAMEGNRYQSTGFTVLGVVMLILGLPTGAYYALKDLKKQKNLRRFILGTDWWTDCDDAVALRLLSRAQERGEIELLGVGINACMEHSVASVCGFLRAEGLDGIPVGIDLEATDFGGAPPYQKRLSENFAPEITNACAEDAARMYRRILAESKRKVEIIEIGFLQVLAALLESPADDLSPLTGIELVNEKVRHIWIMGGKWDIQGGRENNFSRNERARRSAAAVCECCPVPITFLGFEVGYDVISGGNLENTDHLYSVLLDHGSQNGRRSWDPMLTLLAIIGDCEKAGYTAVCGKASVDPETGLCYFERGDGTSHRYVIKNRENSFYENQINSLL